MAQLAGWLAGLLGLWMPGMPAMLIACACFRVRLSACIRNARQCGLIEYERNTSPEEYGKGKTTNETPTAAVLWDPHIEHHSYRSRFVRVRIVE